MPERRATAKQVVLLKRNRTDIYDCASEESSRNQKFYTDLDVCWQKQSSSRD